ncbi:metal ABC transporter ATP-binding protein [bacterium]|nr:metal ABC transporter ATP-binding protein [bacterium]
MTFTVDHGERIAIIGPNGAGKSTLFKAIVGLIPFTMGHISIDGRDCRSSHNLVGYVPQQSDIDWSFPVNVYDVVMMGRARAMGWWPWPRREDREAVHTVLKRLNLTDIAHRQIGALSGGQRRRVFIARALVQETRVLLMDEPFTGVDTRAEADIMATLDLLTAQGITLLLATHDMDKAAHHFDRILLLKRTLLAYGTADDVMQPDVLHRAYGGAMTVLERGGQRILITDEHGAD